MSDNQSLTVVLDASGSMGEMGKIVISHNLLDYVRECLRFGVGAGVLQTLRLFVWGSEVSSIELQSKLVVPTITPSGKVSVAKLLLAVESELDTSEKSRILMLSDGCLAKNELNHLRQWAQQSKHVSVRAVAVGADANMGSLKEIVGDGGLFLPEDISSAIQPWPLDHSCILPTSIGDARFSEDREGGG